MDKQTTQETDLCKEGLIMPKSQASTDIRADQLCTNDRINNVHSDWRQDWQFEQEEMGGE